MTLIIQEMRAAIYQTHNCEATDCVGIERITFRQGDYENVFDVHLFDIRNHRHASQCFVWSEVIDARRTAFPAVLRTSRVSSPEQALRACYRKRPAMQLSKHN
jgi:hypothetical protein